MSIILRGIPASNGVAVGNAVVYDPTTPAIPETQIAPAAVSREWERLLQAIAASVKDVTDLRNQVQTKVGKEEAAIFDAHLLMLEDDALLENAKQHIEQDLMHADRALWTAGEELAQVLANVSDSYFQARASDVRDICTRIINHLQGRQTSQLRYLGEPAMIVARNLLPSDTVELDPKRVLGLVIEQGGPTSHTAILARQLGIPTVVSVPGLLESIRSIAGTEIHVACNGSTGEVVLDPDRVTLHNYRRMAESYRRQQQQLQGLRTLPATTPDGVTVEIAANIGRSQEALPALESGADGVGLFRTEFLFLDRQNAPTEEEQLATYQHVLQIFSGKTVIIRTLDIGGDKHVGYLELPEESNPFLGLRGLRLCMDKQYQPLFRTQLRALLQAAQDSPAALWIMFPMVCDLREVRQAKTLLAETEKALLQEGKLRKTVQSKIRVGIMVETPAAALLLDSLAREADFFSIGTNDLAQYTLASDRMNASLTELHRPFHPAVMRLIAHIVTTAREQQRWVGMCGEMASDPRASAFLLGLGINELSMDAHALNAVKQVIRETTMPQAQALVQRVLAADSADALDELLTSPSKIVM